MIVNLIFSLSGSDSEVNLSGGSLGIANLSIRYYPQGSHNQSQTCYSNGQDHNGKLSDFIIITGTIPVLPFHTLVTSPQHTQPSLGQR